MSADREKNFISAVVYVHNNEKEIEYFLKYLNKTLMSTFENYEIICVDDESKDDSVKIIKNTAKEFENTTVNIIQMSYEQGLEKSMLAGVDFAIGDFVYEFDSCIIDYELSLIIDIYNKSIQGYDIVAASPEKNNNILSSFFYYVLNKFGKGNNKLKSERFRILSRRGINRIHQGTANIVYRKIVYYSCGLKHEHITYKPLIKTNINKNFLYNQNIAIDSIIAFTSIGYKISMAATLIMMCLMIITVIYSLFVKILQLDVSGGWMTLIWIISLSFFVLFGLASIIIRYLSMILRLLNNRNTYLYDSIDKINKN
ncbi:MAG TPA: glycosyltransferase [Candidatus Mucispirillum faecigallinarum]|uniref:Glycosyltransferase n=1 Tax=Candidatus Mucispirillum faecigallinarum TaxID=2838699 RepID=A0A9D2KD01_9BACT|nr:glycosyltransferase [Candidatus Mucispirillum faecigallinarum]